jgi:peptidoglycan/xylan/chitin deacetylase (PgdA/CDA1 family)
MAEIQFCSRHPVDATKRKCFHCDQYICVRCQLKIDHHLFCSRSCHEAYLKTVADLPKRSYRRFALYGMLVLLLGGFLYFALLADAFYSGGDDTEATRDEASIALSLPVAIEERARRPILIDHPRNGLRSVSEQVEVKGPAPHNSVVGVYVNGSLIDSTVAREGYYHFPTISLTKQTNILQTRFYAANGSSDSSPAIMVFYRNVNRGAPVQDATFFQNSNNNISRGNPGRKELALTFDGATESNSAEAILKNLNQWNIRATVFLTYQFVQQYPDLTGGIASKHEVGVLCAPDTHAVINQKITRAELHHQLQKTAELYERTTGGEMSRLWRSPNYQDPEVLRWGNELGYTHVAWTADSQMHQSMDSLDWVTNSESPEYFPALLIKERLLTFGQNEPEQANGSIIVMHFGTQRDSNDRLDRWLPEIINTFRQRGYQFVTVGEMVSHQQSKVHQIQTAKMR